MGDENADEEKGSADFVPWSDQMTNIKIKQPSQFNQDSSPEHNNKE